MRRGTEFATWLAARWPALVRTAVFLGHPLPEAEQVAREAVARTLPEWERERREGDVEVLVYRAVLEERARLLRHRDHDEVGVAPAEPDLPPALADRLELRREVEAHLGTLGPDDRERAVLVHVAELTEDQVDDVLGTTGPTPPMPFRGPEVRDACEAVPVPPAPLAAVLARSRARRRTTRVRASAIVGAAVVLLAATTWWATRPEPAFEPGEVTAASNPLPIPWFADDRLHLARVTVEVGGVQTLVEVPDGVVYADEQGRVVHVSASGKQQQVGETVAGSPLAVDPANGWVAWADPDEGDPELVVRDTIAGVELGRRSLAGLGAGGGQPVGDSGPMAVEGERVYYSSPDGNVAWSPTLEVAYTLSNALVDIADGARISREGGVVRATPAPYRDGTVIDVEDATLTPDGVYAFGTGPDGLTVYDVETGSPVERMYSPSDEAVSWGYHEGTFVFAVLHMLQDKTYQDMLQMPSEGDYRLYACQPGLAEPCRKLGEVPEEVADAPVFAS